jgi:hypothetical protein
MKRYQLNPIVAKNGRWIKAFLTAVAVVGFFMAVFGLGTADPAIDPGTAGYRDTDTGLFIGGMLVWITSAVAGMVLSKALETNAHGGWVENEQGKLIPFERSKND